jgi:hypothetical protein
MAAHGLLRAPVTATQRRTAVLRFGSASLLYPCAVVVGLFSPVAMLLCYMAINAFYIVDQTPILPSPTAARSPSADG